MTLKQKNIVVGISGGIAAFKAVELVRELGRQGARVRVVMTESATRFVGPVTFTGLTGTPPVIDLWDPSYAGEVHVELAAWADAVVVAPATANLLARAAHGLADDALLATLRCADVPVVFAPAMHHRMWNDKATQRAVSLLQADGAILSGPVHGQLASGEAGMGRMAEPAAIVESLRAALAERDLVGRTLVVSAGPTQEDLDPVRFLSNRSSGRMGYALARRAAVRGARVVLVSGPTQLSPPPGCELVPVRTALDMRDAVLEQAAGADAVVMTAAVADYRPSQQSQHKLKKTDAETLTLTLVKNPDVLQELGHGRTAARPVLVGFALETQNVVAYARDKLQRKKVDLIVANHAAEGLGGATNVATLVDAQGEQPLGKLSKDELADRIWDAVKARLL